MLWRSDADMLFRDLEKDEPDHFAVRQYKKYKMAAGSVKYKRLVNQAEINQRKEFA